MEGKKTLHILWTNADLEVARLMVMMYATNSMLHRLWDEVSVILWGPTVRLVAENVIIQDLLQTATQAGVKFSACTSCAHQLGVAEKLEALGIEVIPWVKPFTELLQNNERILTI